MLSPGIYKSESFFQFSLKMILNQYYVFKNKNIKQDQKRLLAFP